MDITVAGNPQDVTCLRTIVLKSCSVTIFRRDEIIAAFPKQFFAGPTPYALAIFADFQKTSPGINRANDVGRCLDDGTQSLLGSARCGFALPQCLFSDLSLGNIMHGRDYAVGRFRSFFEDGPNIDRNPSQRPIRFMYTHDNIGLGYSGSQGLNHGMVIGVEGRSVLVN